MIELALAVTAFVITVAGGLFVVNAIDRASELLAGSKGQPDHKKFGGGPTRGEMRWQPLELEPYKMPWPSETAYAKRTLPEMKWPSESWDDPSFGPMGKRYQVGAPGSLTGNAPLKDERRPAQSQTRRDKQAAESRSRGDKKRRQAQRAQPERHEAAEAAFFEEPEGLVEYIGTAEREPELGDRMAAIALEQARRARQEQGQSRPKPAPKPRPVAESGLPEAEVLRGWVEQYGLAGAVSKLRTQTGWDFQKAARYLAQQVSGRS